MAYSNLTGYPSVTQILDPWIDPTYWTEEARDRGTAVHAAAEAYLKGLFVVPLPVDWQPYFDSLRRWVDEMVTEVVIVEERMVDKTLGFCGKLDLLAVLKGDTIPSQVDWKTSQTPFPWWSLQSAAYRHLIFEDKEIRTERGMTVMPNPDGSGCRVKEYNSHADFAVFQSCLAAYRFFYPNERGQK
jgi:hypothetical protein